MSDSLATPGTVARQAPWDFPSKNTGVGCYFLLQGIFLPLFKLVSPASLALQAVSLPLSSRSTRSHIRAQSLKTVSLYSPHPTHIPLQMPVASPGGHLCFWPTGYELRFPKTPQPSPIPSGLVFSRVACRAQRNILLSSLLIYYQRIYIKNSQMEEMHRARYGEKAQNFHTTLPESPCVVQPRSNPNPVFLDFSVQFSQSVVSNSLQPHGLQHARLPCPLETPGVYSNSCPWSHWCHPIISSSVTPFSSCLQSFPASGSFPVSQFFTSDAKVLEFQLQHQSFQWIFRVDFL